MSLKRGLMRNLAALFTALSIVGACGGSATTPVPSASPTLSPTAMPSPTVGATRGPTTTPIPTASTATTATPSTAPAVVTATAIAAGGLYTCALTNVGGVKCWGINNAGQLGDGSRVANSAVPVDVPGLTNGVSAISTGYGHACAITTGGGLMCWGNNTFGMLGIGSTTYSRVPVDVSGLSSGVSWVAAGAHHTCAVTDGGGVKCWGADTTAGPVQTIPVDSLTPIDVVGLTNGVVAIAAGTDHTCALTSEGGVKCWGWNGRGQLGDGSMMSSSSPVDVVGLKGPVVAIAAGLWRTCAVTSSGEVDCWGASVGEIVKRLGIRTDSRRPFAVAGLNTGATAIAVGDNHICAVTGGGGVKCWGANLWGELGNGSMTKDYSPVDVAGLTNGFTAIAVGVSHSCALASTGVVNCWGENTAGQLGDGSTTNSSTPVDVLFDSAGL